MEGGSYSFLPLVEAGLGPRVELFVFLLDCELLHSGLLHLFEELLLHLLLLLQGLLHVERVQILAALLVAGLGLVFLFFLVK